jgi:hypothetical protein
VPSSSPFLLLLQCRLRVLLAKLRTFQIFLNTHSSAAFCAWRRKAFALIADDELIGITSNGYANFYVDRRLKVLPVEFPAPDVQVGVMFLKNRTITALGQSFIDCAVVVAQALR